MKRIVMDEALSLLKKQVEKKGPDHQSRCVYFEMGGDPMCIIGHVLADLGVTKDQVFEANSTNLETILDYERKDIPQLHVLDGVVEFTYEAKKVLCAAQNKQDDGGTWLEALTEAEAVSRGLVR